MSVMVESGQERHAHGNVGNHAPATRAASLSAVNDANIATMMKIATKTKLRSSSMFISHGLGT